MKLSVKLFRFFSWATLASLSVILAIIASAFLYLSPSLPSVDALKDVHLQTPLRIYTRDQKLIAEFGEKRRQPVEFEALPKNLVQAFMAAEDDRFYSHPGVDPVGLMRAVVQLVTTGRIQSGGSTITMQVAKNFFLSHERVFSRKFNEILLALQIEQELSKDEIFELYLNKIYLGNRAYGIAAAAQVYYDKSIDELTLAQMAMLAGLPKAPSRYNPINDPDRAIIRRDWILGRMKELGYISEAAYEDAVVQPVTARYHGPQIALEAPYVAEMVRQEMVNRFGSEAYTDGFEVYTTLESSYQEAANTAVVNGLMAYSERHGYQGSIRNLYDRQEGEEEGEEDQEQSEPASESDWLQALQPLQSFGVLIPAVVTDVEDTAVSILLKDGEQARIDWDNLKWAKPYININAFGNNPETASDILKTGDIIWVRQMDDGRYRLSQESVAQSSLISMQPKNGAILALVGGFNFYDSMYNRATQAVRQAGSSFKPFIYSSAIANGLTAATIINDAPVVFDDNGLEEAWRPNNDNMRFSGPMRLREGLYRSRNLVSIRILRQVGISATIDYLVQLGFPEEALTRNLSLALGNVSLTPMDLTKGYAMMANGGYKVTPYLIDRVELMGESVFQAMPETACSRCDDLDATGGRPGTSSPLADSPDLPKATQVMEPRVNYIINDILNDVIWRGTGRRARVLGRHDIGGKTGTTNDNKDAWFVGFNPDVLTSVWVGMDNYSTLGRWEYGATAALPIWLEYMRTALKDKPERRLSQPEGLVTLKINPKTGKLARQGSSDAVFEIFRKEFAPKTTGEEEPPAPDSQESSFSPRDLF